MTVRRGWHQRSAGGRKSRWRRYGDLALTVTILLLLALATTRLDRVATRQLEGIVSVADGDSLTLGRERIRLRGIDAPEYGQECMLHGRPYACGRTARQALADLVEGRNIACEGWERDRYDRLLARCATNGRDLGEAMVASGWAISYGDYRAAEAKARSAGLGLWAGSFETPQDWRAGRQGAEEAPHDWLGLIANFLRQIFRDAA